jgi:transposase
MGKYSDQTKLAAAKDYWRGHGGLVAVARRHGVNVASLRQWAAAYRIHGVAGIETRQRKFYSVDFKMTVLRRVRSEKLSSRQAAALFNIRRHDMIGLWQRSYEDGGIAALYPRRSIQHLTMTKQPDTQSKRKKPPPEDKTRTREELLDELQQLRMENAYLKKLEALAQANQQPARGKRPK